MEHYFDNLIEEIKKLSDDKVKLLDLLGMMAIKYLPEADIDSFIHCIYNNEYDVVKKYLGE